MRNVFLIAFLCMLAASCTDKNSYKIDGTIPEEYNGQQVYLFDYDSNTNVDSALVADGKFTFTGLSDTTIFLGLKSDDATVFSTIILEAGTIKVDLSDPLKVSGTPLNDKLIACQTEINRIYDETDEIMTKLKEDFKDDPAGYEEAYEREIDVYKAKNEKLINDHILANNNNAIAISLFADTYYIFSIEKVDSLYALLGEDVKQSPKIQKIMETLGRKKQKITETLGNQKQTNVGQIFTDFTIKNGNIDGSSASFSDYIGKGKYVLVDFWASWCGPCIAENPVIAEVYKKYKGNKFEVLGIAVWDERDDTLEAIKKLNVTWPQIIDAQEIPTDIYGIDGIPHIILFGPDGTILARDLRGEGLKAKVAEVLK
jgi:thiol-disulfide isomerase/thioredoxin